MKNSNKYDLLSYSIMSLILMASFAFAYKRLLFQCIDNCSYISSILIFVCILIVSNMIGFLHTFEKRRNDLSIIVNNLLGLEVYTVIIWFKTVSTWILLALALAIVLSGIYLFFLFYKKDNHTKSKILKRANQGLLGSKTIVVMSIALVLLVPLYSSSLFGFGIYRSSEKAISSVSQESYTISEKIGDLKNFDNNSFKELSNKEKTDLFQILANCLVNTTGIDHEVSVQLDILNKDVIAHYEEQTHKIMINILYINNDSSFLVNAVAHECHHAYQHALVRAMKSLPEEKRDLAIFYNAKRYEYNFNNYIDGSKDSSKYIEYAMQACEVDARQFASEVTDYLFEQIEEETK